MWHWRGPASYVGKMFSSVNSQGEMDKTVEFCCVGSSLVL